MKKNYFENIDPRPKRKMHRDNPYRIFSIGCNTEKPHYYVKFLDNLGVEICLEISKELFDFFDGCELKDLSFINEIDRHAAKIELTPYLLGAISDESVEPMFDCIAKKQKVKALRVAIMILPDKQRRRLLMYYWGDMAYAQIAAIEGCSFQSVMKSLNAAKKNLKVMLKDYN